MLYADYPLASTSQFMDFHVRVFQPKSLRRWLRPQVIFALDSKIAFKPLPRYQAFALLEWGINWCVASHVNQYLVIHAAVIERDGFALIMPAPPGSGKSTLCAALVNRGWRLLSDELALVSPDDLRIIPMPRPVSLKEQSIPVIQDYAPEAILSRPIANTQKGTIAHMKAPKASVQRCHESAIPTWVIFPRYQRGAKAQLGTFARTRALLRLAENSFNYSVLGTLGFNTAADLIESCDCYEFTYSNLDEAIAIFNQLPVSRLVGRQRVHASCS